MLAERVGEQEDQTAELPWWGRVMHTAQTNPQQFMCPLLILGVHPTLGPWRAERRAPSGPGASHPQRRHKREGQASHPQPRDRRALGVKPGPAWLGAPGPTPCSTTCTAWLSFFIIQIRKQPRALGLSDWPTLPASGPRGKSAELELQPGCFGAYDLGSPPPSGGSFQPMTTRLLLGLNGHGLVPALGSPWASGTI